MLCKGFGFSRHFLKYFFVYVEELMNEIQNSFGMSFIVVYQFQIILFRTTKTSLVEVNQAIFACLLDKIFSYSYR